MPASRVKRLAIVVLALGTATLVVLSMSGVQTRLAGWALTMLANRVGIVAHADDLDVDLARLDIRAHGLTLAAPDTRDAPFFTVDVARVDFPWSVLWDEISIDAIELVRPRLAVFAATDGTSNLPAGDGSPAASAGTAEPLHLPIRALTVDGLSIEWRDDAAGLGLTVGSTSLALAPEGDATHGSIRLDGDATIVSGERHFTIASLDGGRAFDGAALTLDQLRLAAGESTVMANGRVDDLFGTPRAEVAYEAVLDLADLAPLLSLETAGAEGRVAVTGDVLGPASEIDLDATLDGHDLRWNALDVAALDGRVRWAAAALAVDAATIRLANGEIVVDGSIALGEDGRESGVEVSWRDLDAATLLRGLGVALDPPRAGGATLAGELSATWTEPTLAGLAATGELRGDLASGSGTTRLDARDGLWRVTIDQPLTPGLRITLAVDAALDENDLAASDLSGTGTLTCSNLARCVGAFGAESATTFRLAGTVTTAVEIAGTLGAPRVTGELSAPALDVAGISPIDVRATMAADREGATLDGLAALSGDTAATGDAHLAWATGAVDGRLEAALDDLSRFAPLIPANWSPAGRLDATVVLAGTLDAPSIGVSVDARDVELAGQRFSRIGGPLRLAGSRFETDGVEIERGPARVRLAGHYEMERGTFAVRLSGDAIELTPLFPGTDEEIPLGGRLALDLDVGGTLAEPRGTLAFEGTALRWAGYPIGVARATAVLDGATLRARAAAPELAATGEVTVGLADDRPFDAHLRVENVDLERAVAGALPLRGSGSMRLDAAGTLSPSPGIDVEARVEALRGELDGFPLVVTRAEALRYREGAIEVDAIEATIGRATLRVRGRLAPDGGGTLDARLDGPAEEMAMLVRLAPGAGAWADRLTLSGEVGLSTAVTGTLETPRFSGRLSLDGGRLGVDDHPPLSDLDLLAVYEPGALRLDRLRAVWQGAVLSASGVVPEEFLTSPEAPAGTAHLEAAVDGLTPAALAPYVSAATVAQLTGRLGARLTVEASAPRLEALRATLTLPEGALTVAGVPFGQRGESRVILDDGVVRVERFDWGNATDSLTVGGIVTLGDGAVADLSVTGAGDLRTLGALVPDVTTAGHALLVADIRGPIAAPRLDGSLELTDAEIRVPEPRLVVSELSGALLITGGAVTAHELRGQMNGGPLEISGSLALDGLQPEGELRLVSQRVAMEVPVGLRTEVDADLVLRLADGQLTVSGTTTVQRGAYREPMSLTGGLLAVLEQQQAVRTIGLDEARALDAIRFDVRIVTANDIRLDNNYLDADLGVDVRLGGTIGDPGLTGRIALREGGQVRFGTRTYEVERGAIDLVNSTGIEPRLDITARTRASRYDITLALNGGPEDLTTAMTSEPPLPESDIVSVLLTGRTLSEATTDGGRVDQGRC